MKPARKQRTFDIVVYNLKLEPVTTITAALTFNEQDGNYQGKVPLLGVSSGQYQFSIKTTNTLRKLIQGAFEVQTSAETKLPPVSLTVGDINSDNRISAIDYSLLLDCYSDLTQARNCNSERKTQSDLNDDTLVNFIDYNLFIRELSVQSGQ